MKVYFVKGLLSAVLTLCSLLALAQMPFSPCSPSGGKRADLLGVEAKYKAPGAPAPTFNIPAGTRSITVYISSETGITTGGDNPQGDEDFITINAIIDISANTSSGYVNYAKNTNTNGTGTNLYGWQKAPLGAFIPAASKIGDAAPDLNNVNFSISGSTLTITESATGTHSSYYLEYVSPYNNSLNPLDPAVKALLHGTAAANTDLVVPIPAGTNIICISGKGTNSNATDLNSSGGTEEGYSNLRFTIDLDAGLTDGFITLSNGGAVDRRSTYVINNLSSSSTMSMAASAAITGDYAAKLTSAGAVGIFNPQIYVSGTNLVIRRDASYARDFDDAYVVEFYRRVGQGMSAEFINSDIQVIAKGLSSAAGVSRTFIIPPGTNAIYLNETGNACNTDRESNENSLAAYAYIDLTTETATGYFYQQVGLDGANRRDDNYAFKGVPLNNSSARGHANTVGFKSVTTYDISFALSPDKSTLTITNKTGLANPDYQILMSVDYYGARPDIAFNSTNITFSKGSSCKMVRANVNVCNPGSGNSNGGMPVSFYHGDPTTDPTAVLLHTGAFNQDIHEGECKTFTYDIDLSNFSNLDIDLTIIINDNGSFVPGGVGHTVGTPFTLTSLSAQNTGYKECYYDNNLITKTVDVNNCPVVNLDPDNSSAATGSYNYLNYFNAGSTGARIADNDLNIIDPDGGDIHRATITLTNILEPGNEGLFLNGALPAGITITGNGAGVVVLSGQASQADYIAALKMIEYRNTNGSPNTTNRIITTALYDGIETGPASTTTIVILTNPRINVTGNGTLIADNSTVALAVDGTDFGTTTSGIIARTFSIHNVGTGIIDLTGTPAVSFVSGDPGFIVATQPALTSITVGGSTDFVLSFNPAAHAVGVYTALVRVRNNDTDADRADYTFTVSATVNNLPVLGNNTVTGLEDNTLAFAATDFTGQYNDPDGTPLNRIRITSLPLNGSFRLNGIVITAGQEIPFAQLANITFIPTGNWSGSTGFDWRASDGTSYSTGSARTTINILPGNDGPQITVPTSIAVTEDVPASLKDISFTDIDAGSGIVTVTFSVPNGTLNAASGAGVTVSGTPDALVLNGALTDINAFLAGNRLTYSSTQNPPAAVTLTVNISDNGNTGVGGALQDTKTVTLGITALNDAPVGTDETETTDEDTPLNGTVTATDADSDPLTYTKASDPAHGTVTVNIDGSYTYTPAANYHGPDQFTIEVSDGQGGTDIITVTITVNSINDLPVGTDETETTDEDIPLNGVVTATDADSDPLTYTKGSDPTNGTVTVDIDGSYTYTPSANYHGSDQFTVEVSDGHGGTDIITVAITVNSINDIPVGTDETESTDEDTPLSGVVTATDADGDPLTYTKASDPAHGTVTVNIDGSYTYTPNLNYHGPDQFTVEVSDGHGGTDIITVAITVNSINDLPVGTDETETTDEDTPLSGVVTATDADSDPLTYTKGTDPAHGTVTVNTDGSYTYTPAANYHGPDQFTVEVSDGHGGTDIITVAITVNSINDIPVGTDETETTDEDTPLSGVVTATDADSDPLTYTKATDPAHGTVTVNTDGSYTYTPNPNYHGPDQFTIEVSDGHGGTDIITVTITVNSINDLPVGTDETETTDEDTPLNGTVTATDADSDPLTYTKASDPSHGTVTVNIDGSYTYTPAANYHGPDQFTIEVNDGHGGTDIITVAITVNSINDIPVGTDETETTDEDTPLSGVVTATDADSDPLTYTKATDPAHGTVTVNTDGSYTYTPNPNYHGPDQFTIEVSDGHGGTDIITVTITVNSINDLPVGTDETETTDEDTPLSGVVTATDADSDPLTYTKATDPAHGTVTVNTDGSYTYTPNLNYHGPDQFTVEVSDGHGGTDIITVTITVNSINDIPVGTDETETTDEDTPLNGTVTATDADGDPLTYTKATDPAHGTVTVNTDGSYTYTPSANYHGPDQFTIEVNDGHGGTDIITVTITVNSINDLPVGTDETETTDEDTPLSGVVTATDADSDPLTYTKATDPAHGTVTVNTDGSYTYTPNLNYHGPDQFTIEVNDGHGGTDIITVTITVNSINDIPVGTDETETTDEDTPLSGVVTATDADSDPLTYTKGTDPAHGTVTVNTDGSYTYTPSANYHGPDQFTIEVNDGQGGTDIITVTITVNSINDLPVGTDETETTDEDTPLSGVVTATDADSDPLTYTKATDPAHGTVTVNTDGSYTYTPSANYHGPDQFTIEVNDGQGGTDIITVTITVNSINDLPVGTDETETTDEDTPLSGVVTATDADSDPLTYTKATDPAHGTATVSTDGSYTYTPSTNYHGPDQFTIEVNDGHGGVITVTITINITPVNDAPTGLDDIQTTNENTPVSAAITATDIDGDPLTFTKAGDPAHGTVIVNANGTYTYTPNAAYTGPDQFTIRISDGHGGTATVTVTITVLPITANAGITLVKLALLRADRISITYIFNVTNTGSLPLHDVTITDPMLGLTRTLPGELQPGALITETAVYRLTQADRERGSVSNTATASGQTPVNTTVTDISGATAASDMPTEITVPAAPAALDDEGETRINTPVTIPVLANDNALHSAFNPASVSIITGPKRGQVSVNEDGSVTYTPENGYTGEDNFTYRVQDEDGYLTNIAVVTLGVVVGDIKIPTLFTPNGDGKNDVFEIRGLNKYPENELVVINRWGNEVFRQKNYQNNWKGEGLNEGTYYYLLRIKKNNGGEWEIFKGYTTIIRKFRP